MSKRSSLSATSFFSPSPIARRLTPDIDAFPATPSRSPSGRLRSTSSQVAGVLDLLKTIFEGVDSFPCIKYVAGVGVKILEVIEEVQANNERLRDLAMRAGEVVVAVSRSCQGLKSNTEAELERDLTQLTSVMTAILAFTTENASKGRITQIIQRSEFASALDMLDKQLMHAFQIFQIQSSISLRMSSSKIIDAVTSTSKDVVNKQIFPVPSEPIDIDEGFYMLCNVSDGRVVEIENQHGPSHVFLSPSRDGRALSQVWAISKIPSTEAQYTIRNVAVGNTLDLNHFEERSGSYVIAWPGSKIVPGLNHTWTFHRVKGAEGVDYCVIRTCQGSARSFFDGACPVSKKCDYLHCTHLSSGSAQMSQLWILISFPPSAAVPSEPAALVPKQRIHRPRFLLQNVSTAAYATVIQVDQDEDVMSNVILTSDPTKATRWSFMLGFDGYPTLNNSGSLVAHLPESPSGFFDLDHWNQEKIRVFDFWPQNDHRRWYPIPRDGAFAFRNEASGEYLSAGDGHVVHTSPDIMGGGATCAWRLVDPETMQHSRVLWDPIATMLPEGLSPLVPTSSVDSMTREGKFLRTKPASPRSHAELLASLEDGQHSLVRDMLTSGDTLVVMPGLTLAWRRGRVHKVLTSEDENIFRTQRWRGRRDDFSNQCLEE